MNYYDVLGVSKNASAEDIKKAYKKLVIKWHPDRWVNGTDEEKKIAEEKIKEINEANSVLSDPEKRQNYDMFGTAEGVPNGGGGFDPFEGFDMGPFGFRMGRTVEKGTDIFAEVTVTMAESYSGISKKEVKVRKPKPCSHCNGTGSEDGIKHNCPQCGGSGKYTRTTRNANGFSQFTMDCPYCHGTGVVNTKPCHKCGGTGIEYDDETITIQVPAGIFNNAEVCMQGKGNAPRSGSGINGDLYIRFNVLDEPNFRRDRNNIVTELELTLLEAWDGCKKKIPFIDGSKISVEVPKGSREGNTITVSGKGFKDPNNPFRTGDLIVVIRYKVPKKITKEQRKLIEEFYKLEK